MSIYIESKFCPQNHQCPLVNLCPVGAISQDGYGLPSIDPEKCIHCSKCVKMCPGRAVKENKMLEVLL